MAYVPVKVKKPTGITKENAMLRVAQRRALAAAGKIKLGKPRGVLGLKKRLQIQSEQEMVKAIVEKSGFIIDNLLANTDEGDTRAALGLLDRAYGKATERVQHTVEFSLVALGDVRKTIDGNKDVAALPEPVAAVDAPDEL